MSLIDNGPHTVRVFLEEQVTDWRGTPRRQPKAGGPVTVTGCQMQVVSSARGAFSARDIDEGQRVNVVYKLICRNAPAGWWSAVEWDDPQTRSTRRFTPLGGPQFRDHSPLSSHLSMTLQEVR